VDKNVVLSSPLFAGISSGEAKALLETVPQLTLRRGKTLYREGEPGDRLYVIAEGKIKLGNRSNDRESLLAVLGPGDLFGELSLFDPGPRGATATTVDESVVYELRNEMFAKWIEQHPPMAMYLLGVLAAKLRRANESLGDMVFADVPGRLAKALLDLANRFGVPEGICVRLTHGLTQEELAQLVGATRETVNKTLADFELRGWIRREGRSLVVQDLERLGSRAR